MKFTSFVTFMAFMAFSPAFSQEEGASIVKYLQWNGAEYKEVARATVLNSELEKAEAKCQRWLEAGTPAGKTRYCLTVESPLR